MRCGNKPSKHEHTGLVGSSSQQDRIERLYIELDGVLARLRRGSVPMEEQERKRKGDVYREVKVGAVFEATRGPERSGLAPGVFVDQAGQKHYVARRTKAEDFGKLLYALAVTVWAATGAATRGLRGWGRVDLAVGRPNTFRGPCKSSTSGMRANMSGR